MTRCSLCEATAPCACRPDPPDRPQSVPMLDPFAAMLDDLRARTARPCRGGCGAETMVDRCDACEAREAAIAARQTAIAETDRSIPAGYRWATFDSQDLAGRVRVASGKSVAMAAPLASFSRIVFVGEPGVGKTSLAVAMLRKRVAASGQRGAFVHAHRLGVARIQHSAGDGEAAIVEFAMRAPLLLLDDVGTERQTATNAVPDVILERHAEGLPTWVTTWLSPREAAEKYGGGVARRIFEDTKVIRLGNSNGAGAARGGTT